MKLLSAWAVKRIVVVNDRYSDGGHDEREIAGGRSTTSDPRVAPMAPRHQLITTVCFQSLHRKMKLRWNRRLTETVANIYMEHHVYICVTCLK